MNRINKLTLKNFKFFHGTQEIAFGKNNILLYGENGSGKSSIYWALYTFLQSVFKTDDREIQKYFDPTHDQNLVNRFAANTDESSIVIEFEDDSTTKTVKQISFNTINTKAGDLVKEANQTSDFINYRLLSSLYNFSNRDQIDLFPLFASDILMFVNFTTEFRPGNSNADHWWKFLEPGMQPRSRMHDPEYGQFQDAISGFNRELENFINKIIEGSNEYLQQKFKENFKLKLEYVNATYDDFVEGSTTKRNHLTIPPKILLTVEYLHSGLAAGKGDIKRPHSFLNEARLTSIALSIRFAVLDEKYIASAPKFLILDDLLISLDMTHRETVLNIILNEFKEYQIFIMTHDRMFFELAKHKIKRSKQDNWAYIEMYQTTKGGVPQPYIVSTESYLEKAKRYFNLKEYEVAGNFLRKEAEAFCKDFLPRRKQYKSDFSRHDLNGLIMESIQFAKDNSLDITHFEDLESHRKFVLNSASHDSYDVPKYNGEIANCIETIEQIKKTQFDIVFNKGDKVEFEVVTADGKDRYKFEITFQEEVKLLKQPGQESVLSKAMANYFVFKNGVATTTDVQHANIRLLDLYKKIYDASDKAKTADYWEEIFILPTNEKLKTIRTY